MLSPARNVTIAREAILHGADAVYIGAPRFGARAAAGNSLDEIRELVEFAHIYWVKVYVTLNTILYDDELEDARLLAAQLYKIGVDALIVQDMAFLEMDLPPIPLHASTQMDNRNADKVRLLQQSGFEQVVLARELSLNEIRRIHESVPTVQLEAFVHGATCVSYNGQCYASQYCFGRSANRGECAQFCRLPFDLVDSEGRIVKDAISGRPVNQRHILSLHDMNRSADVEAMMDAGIVSFKIEGRLKDEAYVKNVTAYYRNLIDQVIKRRPDEFKRASIGYTICNFTPQLDRTFNRGFSDYFLHGRSQNMVQQFSPKSIGQMVGHVKEIRRNCFTVSTTVPFANGDGICYFDASGNLHGCRVNRVEGNCIYPKDMPSGLLPRMPLYRNYDHAFNQQLARQTAQRRILVLWHLSESKDGIEVVLSCRQGECDEGKESVCKLFPVILEEGRTPQYDNIVRQLSRLGDTPFCLDVDGVHVHFSRNWFLPSSILADWRRELVGELVQKLQQEAVNLTQGNIGHAFSEDGKQQAVGVSAPMPFAGMHLTYQFNVSNNLSRQWYARRGAVNIQPAMERGGTGKVLMTLRYCPRYELGLCKKTSVAKAVNDGPLFLRSSDQRLFPLSFDCRNCMVQVLAPHD